MKVTESIVYVGVNDHEVDLFEGQYKVPNGMSYNSYVILDEQANFPKPSAEKSTFSPDSYVIITSGQCTMGA